VKGVILYGPPASGKDTVTRALVEADPRCELFPRLKAGPGKADTYRLTTREHIASLRADGRIAWENTRYDALYAVDTPELIERLARGIPILHLGQVPAIDAIRRATPGALWLVVALWCARDLAERRLMERNPSGRRSATTARMGPDENRTVTRPPTRHRRSISTGSGSSHPETALPDHLAPPSRRGELTADR
jgi:guanylate kinase